jgi:DNA-binding CsgD family transcriptional regulator
MYKERVSSQARFFMSISPTPSLCGLVLLDRSGNLVYCNDEAKRVLSYPSGDNGRAHTLERDQIRRLVAELYKGSELRFASGRRTYVVRCFVLLDESGSRRKAILLERPRKEVGSLSICEQAMQHYNLTGRERQVLNLLIAGLTTKEIGLRLHLSPNTVKSFLRTLMLKMGVSSRSGLVGKLVWSVFHDATAIPDLRACK